MTGLSSREAIASDAAALYDDVDEVGDPLAFADVDDDTLPALSRLALDVRAYRRALLDGFDDRRAVLEWCVGSMGATLGRIDGEWYEWVHAEFVTDTRSDDRPPLLGALLDVDAAVPNATAREFRERIAAGTYAPAASAAVRVLREDAQEVAPSRDGPNVAPEREQHVAMRPSLSQIEAHQARALDSLLAGFAAVDELLAWGDTLDLATHGEIPDDYLATLATSDVARQVLLVGDGQPGIERFRPAREVVGAWLLTYFAAGTRQRLAHAAEVSHQASNDDRSKTL
jgi:hypothetical protein